MMKKHEDADEECVEDVFEYLDKEEDTAEETPNNNPFLDAFKNFKDN